MLIRPKIRSDKQGDGSFGSPRKNSKGSYKHQGIDFIAKPGDDVFSDFSGVVTKIGRPYYFANPKNQKQKKQNDLRYVQITDDEKGLNHRFFYVDPCIGIGDPISFGDKIGCAQNLEEIYKNMDNHVHQEIKDRHGNILDPNDYL